MWIMLRRTEAAYIPNVWKSKSSLVLSIAFDLVHSALPAHHNYTIPPWRKFKYEYKYMYTYASHI